jgi:hypothetical protein
MKCPKCGSEVVDTVLVLECVKNGDGCDFYLRELDDYAYENAKYILERHETLENKLSEIELENTMLKTQVGKLEALIAEYETRTHYR